MNRKYKPGFFFALLTAIFNLVIIHFQYPESQNHLVPMLASVLISATIAGCLFGWMWNRLKNKRTQDRS